MKRKKETIDIYAHLEMLDNSASGVIYEVTLIPFDAFGKDSPIKEDGSVNAVIDNESLLKMIGKRDMCYSSISNSLDVNGVFIQSVTIYSQLLRGKTINQSYVEERFGFSDKEQMKDYSIEVDLSNEDYFVTGANIAAIISSLSKRYDLRIWVRDIKVDGEALKSLLEGHITSKKSPLDKLLEAPPLTSPYLSKTGFAREGGLDEPNSFIRATMYVQSIHNLYSL